MRLGAEARRPTAATGQAISALAVVGLLVTGSPPVVAQPVTTTKVKHYVVNGTTAQSLDQQMTTRGPWHGRGRAYANIVVNPGFTGQLVQGSSCNLHNFKVTAEFTMTLPKLANGAKLSRDLQSRWASFVSFVRRHEEGHRTIWLDCMSKAERRVAALRAGTCPELNSKIDRVFEEEWQVCERRQDAYDLAEQQKLVRHPLLVAASRVQRATAQQARAVSPARQTRAPRFGRAAH